MEKTIDWKKFVFKDSLNFYEQLQLTDLNTDNEQGKIRWADFFISLVLIFLLSIDGKTDSKVNANIVKNLEDNDAIGELAGCIEEATKTITENTAKKKKK